ncbi:ABC transporter permease [Micrococcales bacterium 31B]|nr:ABC transporter permease [Micrococcales bacterium 31B]
MPTKYTPRPDEPEAPDMVTARRNDSINEVTDAELERLERGLDHLQVDDPRGPQATPGQRTVRAVNRVLPPLIALGVLVTLWQAYVTFSGVRTDIVPGPFDVARAVAAEAASGDLGTAVGTSLWRGLSGFVLSVVIGTLIGLVLAQVQVLRRALGPLISGLQVLPSVAWVPAAILWFGLTNSTIYFVLLMGAIPSIVNGLLSGVDQVPPTLTRMGRVLGAQRLDMALRIILPAALTSYVGGLKQGWAFSWRSLMAAEIIAMGGSLGFGMGSLLQQSRELADAAGVMVAIIAILLIGIVIELLVFAPVERRVLARRGLSGR